jgi:hypothetical protein
MKTLISRADQLIPTKHPRLIESSQSDPFWVISEIFQSTYLQDFRDNLLPKWLRTSLINENSIYTEASHRTQLLHLYDHLLTLTEALYVIHVQQRITDNESITLDSDEIEKPILLTEDQLAVPMEVIAAFRQRFSPEYTRRELWHFLEAGVNHSGDYPAGFSPGYALMCYDHISCLTEAAYHI